MQLQLMFITWEYTGWPAKMSLFFFGNNFYKNKETFKKWGTTSFQTTTLNRRLEYLRHNSHGTNSFHVKPITPGHPITKISIRLAIFWGGVWKTEFLKTIHRQERISSEKKSDGLHKKCSIELWTILLFELLLCYHTAARCMEQT